MEASNTWQAFQWFDMDAGARQQLHSACDHLKSSGQPVFSKGEVLRLLETCPVQGVDVDEVIEQFNGMLHTWH